MYDPNHPHNIEHRNMVGEALANGMGPDDEVLVPITRGELLMFHTLLQDFGLNLIEDAQFIPLVERSMNRMRKMI